MLRPVLHLLAFAPVAAAQAPCDYDSVEAWLRTINYDTVQICRHSKQHGQPSTMWFYDDSTFDYWYYDSASGNECYMYYKDYRLRSYNFWRGDRLTSYSYSYYHLNSCQPTYFITEVWNDSLSTDNEGGTVYDYYHEIVYKEDGSKSREYLQTVVFRNKKRYSKTVYVNYEGVIVRRKVFYHKQTQGNN